MKGPSLAIVLYGTVVIVAAGCGGSSSSSSPAAGGGTTTEAASSTITINESEFKLAPSSIKVAKPGTYVLKAVNKGSVTHSLEIEGQGVEKKIEDIAPGKSGTLTVEITKPGSYELYCPIDGHRAQGMEGTLVVGGAGGGGGGTTTGTTTGRSGGGYGY